MNMDTIESAKRIISAGHSYNNNLDNESQPNPQDRGVVRRTLRSQMTLDFLNQIGNRLGEPPKERREDK